MNKTLYAICGLSVLLFSCRNEEPDISVDPARQIYLRAAVDNTIVMSRAPFSQSTPTAKNPLKVAVWASTEWYKFENSSTSGTVGNVVALHTSANFSDGEEQLLNDAVYPVDGTKVFFVGLHPTNESNTVWTTDAAASTATMTFTGCEDVMFAPQISGVYGENTGETEKEWPTFKFRHLLTCLRVTVKSEGEAVSEAWGKLQSLQLKSTKGKTVTIDLTRTYDPTNPDKDIDLNTCVAFSTSEFTYDLYKTGSDTKYENQSFTLPYKNQDYTEVAYVLCAPVEATVNQADQLPVVVRTSEYTLIVTTDNRRVEVPIDLKETDSETESGIKYFSGSTMNHQFIVNLLFKMGNKVSVKAKVADWQLGGISNGVLDPDKKDNSGTTSNP